MSEPLTHCRRLYFFTIVNAFGSPGQGRGEQFPGAARGLRGEQRRQIRRLVDIERDARQVERHRLDPARPCCGEVAAKARRAEAQAARDRPGRTAPRWCPRRRAPARSRSLGRWRRPRTSRIDVGGARRAGCRRGASASPHASLARCAPRRPPPRCGPRPASSAEIPAPKRWPIAIASGSRVATKMPASPLRAGQRIEHVLEHGQHELAARAPHQARGQAAASPPPSSFTGTTAQSALIAAPAPPHRPLRAPSRARASRSASVRISVFATTACTGKPDAASRSARSST